MEVARTSQIQSTWYYNPTKPSLKYHHTLKTSKLNPKSGFHKMLVLSISYNIYKTEQICSHITAKPSAGYVTGCHQSNYRGPHAQDVKPIALKHNHYAWQSHVSTYIFTNSWMEKWQAEK
jgi:hypothetical protein